jgi:hypothetical protein
MALEKRRSDAMHYRLRLAAILATAPLLALSLVAFPAKQQAGCVRGIAGSPYNQRLFRSLMHRKDRIAARLLSVYNVPRVSSLEVRPVIDPVVCHRAAVAYGKVVRQEDPGRKVHILRVGTRYIVMDPDFVIDNRHRAVTFDSTLTKAIALIAE